MRGCSFTSRENSGCAINASPIQFGAITNARRIRVGFRCRNEAPRTEARGVQVVRERWPREPYDIARRFACEIAYEAARRTARETGMAPGFAAAATAAGMRTPPVAPDHFPVPPPVARAAIRAPRLPP